MIKKQTLLVAVGFCLLTACSGNNETGNETAGGQLNRSFLTQVKTVEATESAHETEMTLTGKVVSDPDKTVSYTPLVSGVVERTYFSLGDKVKKGQTLMDIRSTELSALESDLITQETELKIAQREWKTAQSMYQDGLLSERELLEAEGQVKQAEAVLAKTKADISVFGVSKGRGTFSVIAPMDGYIITKSVSAGSTVSAENEPAFTIAGLESVWIIANVYASNLSFVREGMDAFVSALSYPGEQFPGKISSLSQVFDPEDKALKARIVMDNPQLKLKPEMSVVIRLKEEYPSKKVAVPSEAVIFDNDIYFIVVAGSDDDFSFRRVTPVGHHAGTTFLANGIQAGERVVVKNQLLIYSELKGK
ncbi:MAG: efflux RND transporter periplasmic adaptor subunit [Tannerellaceae bacterium]|nr:efflux RND transporter periplasmic adaptor subunit [Tannerellaceae bacterium]